MCFVCDLNFFFIVFLNHFWIVCTLISSYCIVYASASSISEPALRSDTLKYTRHVGLRILFARPCARGRKRFM